MQRSPPVRPAMQWQPVDTYGNAGFFQTFPHRRDTGGCVEPLQAGRGFADRGRGGYQVIVLVYAAAGEDCCAALELQLAMPFHHKHFIAANGRASCRETMSHTKEIT